MAKFGLYAVITRNLLRTVNFGQNIEFDNFGQYWPFGAVYSVLMKICATDSIFAVFGKSLLFLWPNSDSTQQLLKTYSERSIFLKIPNLSILTNIGHLVLFTSFTAIWWKFAPRTPFLPYLKKVCVHMAKFGLHAIISWNLLRTVNFAQKNIEFDNFVQYWSFGAVYSVYSVLTEICAADSIFAVFGIFFSFLWPNSDCTQ